MRKLLKFIFSFVAILLSLAFVLVLVVFFILYDNEKPNFTSETEYTAVDIEVGHDLNHSLYSINSSKYENNNIELSVGIDSLNGVLVDIIRESINEEYLISTDKVISINSISIDSIFFTDEGDSLGLKLRVSAMGFFKTTFTLSTKLSCANNMVLVASFNKFGLGNNISIDGSYLEDILNQLGQEFNNEVEGFKITDKAIEIDLKHFLLSSSDSLFFDLMSATDIDVEFKEGAVIISSDTSNIFSDFTFENPKTMDGISDAVANSISNPNEDGSYTINLTEEQFNYLVSQDVNENINRISKTYEIGENNFSISIIKDSVYYNIFDSKIGFGIKFNNIEASGQIDITRTIFKENDHVSSINIEVGGLKIGQCYIDEYSKHLSNFSISEEQLLSSMALSGAYSIRDIEFDDASKLIKITIS